MAYSFRLILVSSLCLNFSALLFHHDLEGRQESVAKPEVGTTSPLTVTQEFRYHAPEAGEVWLVWGINGWQHVPDANRPSGTTVKENALHSPLVRAGDVFTAAVHAQPGTTIDFGFLITKTKDGTPVRIWQAQQSKDFHVVVDGDRIIEIDATVFPRPKDLPKAGIEETRISHKKFAISRPRQERSGSFGALTGGSRCPIISDRLEHLSRTTRS